MEKYFLHKKVLEADLNGVKEAIMLKADLDELDTFGNSPLHWAVFGGDYDIVKVLLEAGANPNTFSIDGVTPKWRAQDFDLSEIELLLGSFGGKVDTDTKFDKKSFSAFNNLIGRSLPREKQ